MDVVIIGAGGHGKVVLDILRLWPKKYRVVGFIDADPALAGQKVAGVRVLGPANLLSKLRRRRIGAAIVAIGDNRTRQQYIAEAREAGLRLVNAIHPRAIVSRSARLGENVMIAGGAVVCAEATIGDGSIVNTAAVVDHECVLDSAVHIGPTAALAGRVKVGAGAFIGLGAKVLPCLSVGAWSTVGAGAVVIQDLPDQVTVVGVPARRTR